MKKSNLLGLALILNLWVLAGFVGGAGAAEEQIVVNTGQDSYQSMLSLLKKHDKKLSREMRQVKRELAVLKQSIEKPDAKDIISGIGYIFGLFGVAAYMASRKGNK